MKLRIRRFAPFFLVAALGMAASSPASASTCTGPMQVLESIWSKYSAQLTKLACKTDAECFDNAEKNEKLVNEMKEHWNKMANGDWATIGPRALLFGANNDGKVVVGLQRIFITKLPLDTDEVEIRFKKEGGGAAVVSIARNDGKRCLEGQSIQFEKSDKKGKVHTLTVKKTKGMLVVIKVDAKDLDMFDYEFIATKK